MKAVYLIVALLGVYALAGTRCVCGGDLYGGPEHICDYGCIPAPPHVCTEMCLANGGHTTTSLAGCSPAPRPGGTCQKSYGEILLKGYMLKDENTKNESKAQDAHGSLASFAPAHSFILSTSYDERAMGYCECGGPFYVTYGDSMTNLTLMLAMTVLSPSSHRPHCTALATAGYFRRLSKPSYDFCRTAYCGSLYRTASDEGSVMFARGQDPSDVLIECLGTPLVCQTDGVTYNVVQALFNVIKIISQRCTTGFCGQFVPTLHMATEFTAAPLSPAMRRKFLTSLDKSVIATEIVNRHTSKSSKKGENSD
jgi:hypothetical protein